MMDWRSKVLATKEMLAIRPELTIVFDMAERGAPESALRELQELCPYLPPDYLEFLRLADGIRLDMFVICGTGASPFPEVRHLNKILAETWANADIPPDSFFAFGEDAGGGAFAFDSQGAVFLFEVDPPDGVPHWVADRFSDLLEDVFMGPGYFSFFSPDYTNDWTAYLEEQHWVEPR